MKDQHQDILQSPSLKENPFTVPQGYFRTVEDRVHVRIRAGERKRDLSSVPETDAGILIPAVASSGGSHPGNRRAVIRSSAVLLSFFLFIFAIGYGVISLTRTVYPADFPATAQLENAGDSVSRESLLKAALRTGPINESEMLESFTAYNEYCSDTLPAINTESIEQYLIDSDISLVMLASLE